MPRAEVLRRMAESVLSEGSAKARARHQVLVHTMEGSDEAWYETERGVLPVAAEVLEEALGGQEVLVMDAAGRVEAAAQAPRSEGLGTLTEAEAKSRSESDFELLGKSKSQPGNVSVKPDDEPSESQACADHGIGLIDAPADHLCDSPEVTACSPPTHTSDSQSPKRTAIPNATIRQVFARAGHRCECCGRKGGRLDVHHRDPVSEGGGHNCDCLELLCRACHTKNHEPDFEEKRHWRAARDAALVRRLAGEGWADSAVEFKQAGEQRSLGRRR